MHRVCTSTPNPQTWHFAERRHMNVMPVCFCLLDCLASRSESAGTSLNSLTAWALVARREAGQPSGAEAHHRFEQLCANRETRWHDQAALTRGGGAGTRNGARHRHTRSKGVWLPLTSGMPPRVRPFLSFLPHPLRGPLSLRPDSESASCDAAACHRVWCSALSTAPALLAGVHMHAPRNR